MILDVTPFSDFDTFFAWYISIIKSKVPDFLSLESNEIHKRIGTLTDEEFEFTVRQIRRMQKIPKNIGLMNDNKAGTFYATWDKGKGKPMIAFPSVMYYWLKYPPIVKGIIQHELGHCVGSTPDILSNTKLFPKSDLVNISMDVRINQNIDYETLNQIYKCNYKFDNNPFELEYIPEFWMPNKCGLPSSLKTKATWTWLYKSYEEYNPKGVKNDEEVELEEGTYVITTVDKHGKPVGTYGIITNIKKDIGKVNYTIAEISAAEIEALKKDDYEFFDNLSHTLSGAEIGDYEYNKALKEIKIVKVPVFDLLKPKEGDIALLIKDTGSINKGKFGIVMYQTSENSYQINEFSDKLQTIIMSGDFDKFMKYMSGGKDLFTSNIENAIFAKDFILNNLQEKPQGGGKKPPETEKKINKPQVGDIVVISQGENAGKYGVIEEVNDGKYVISEVSEEIVKIKTGRKF
jgi:hypothetical protein